GICLEVDFRTPIPSRICSDPTRIRQVLLNLLGNAVKFTSHGKVTLQVEYRVELRKLRFAVIDTGIGMSEEQCDLIRRFDAFTQADTTMTRKYGGTGLGLRISNSLAQMLGGSLEVESAVGMGSMFALVLEVQMPHDASLVRPSIELTYGDGQRETAASSSNRSNAKGASADSSSAVQADNGKAPLHGVRILLAEDGADNQRLISFILKKSGAQATVVENGSLAIDAIERAEGADAPFHVVLMDMQMPVMDGYTAATRLRQSGYGGQIIALTAHAMAEDRQKCIDAGCDDYATKPIDREALLAKVRECAAIARDAWAASYPS
ncbi:MAG: response regulator, partial [Planctomycetales bacterium]|nr:response regulator [Planctomycetales bacterium]